MDNSTIANRFKTGSKQDLTFVTKDDCKRGLTQAAENDKGVHIRDGYNVEAEWGGIQKAIPACSKLSYSDGGMEFNTAIQTGINNWKGKKT
jgi:hypothetical protein